jgi:hypothetical protein
MFMACSGDAARGIARFEKTLIYSEAVIARVAKQSLPDESSAGYEIASSLRSSQ